MSKEDYERKSKFHSTQIKEGIKRVKAEGKKLGRPSIFKSKDDPQIAVKASDLRSQGLSWSQIASRLGIGRTTARRLVTMYLNDNSVKLENVTNPSVPKSNDYDISESKTPIIISSTDDDILGKLPKSFQIFSNLLEKAKKAQRKRGG